MTYFDLLNFLKLHAPHPSSLYHRAVSALLLLRRCRVFFNVRAASIFAHTYRHLQLTDCIEHPCAVTTQEKIVADSKIYHKQCLKCEKCKKTLQLGNYAAIEGTFYCKPHFSELFKLRVCTSAYMRTQVPWVSPFLHILAHRLYNGLTGEYQFSTLCPYYKHHCAKPANVGAQCPMLFK